MTQVAFSPESFRSQIIARRKDFDGLFEGFTSLRAVSYVTSPELLLKLQKDHGLEEIEVVVGDSLTSGRNKDEELRQNLGQKGLDVVEELATCVEQGTIRILVPSRPIHTKFYLLIGDKAIRVINTSANLTLTAQEATRQMNYAWYLDLPFDDPSLSRLTEDYNQHAGLCSLFMGDLIELFRDKPQGDRREIIEAWLKGAVAEADHQQETRSLFQTITAKALENGASKEEARYTVSLSSLPPARKEAERLIAPFGTVNGTHAVVDKFAYVHYVQKTINVPLMTVDMERQEVRLSTNDSVVTRTERPRDPEAVSQALEHLEEYLNTVDWGKALDKELAKASMLEALLYLLSAPFAHELMKIKQRRQGSVDFRGPRFLYIYGASQNGKSTFLRFVLKLLTGSDIKPFPGNEFTKRKVAAATLTGTSFPLIFDDIDTSRKREAFDYILKNHWEVGWREEHVVPQVIFTSNVDQLREWAKTRIKRVDFDVQFVETDRNKERLSALLRADNPLFTWFSALYFEGLRTSDPLVDDELSLARQSLRKLYEFCGRTPPTFFHDQPIEQLFDRGRKDWNDLLSGIRKARTRKDGARLYVEFLEEMQPREIQAYRGQLPQSIKTVPRGKTLVVENPDDFYAWLNGTPTARPGFLQRFRSMLTLH